MKKKIARNTTTRCWQFKKMPFLPHGERFFLPIMAFFCGKQAFVAMQKSLCCSAGKACFCHKQALFAAFWRRFGGAKMYGVNVNNDVFI